MLSIPLTQAECDNLADKHAKALLGLIKGRLNKRSNKFLKSYFIDDQKILNLLKAGPDDLKKENNAIVNSLTLAGHTRKKIIKVAKVVFSYKYFFKKNPSTYCAFDLCESIGLMTCPYCNINFAHTIHKAKASKLILRPPLDHFLAVSSYPFVALSFYNLIPSCWVCNSSFKTTQDTDVTTHLNPYAGAFGDNCVLDFKDYKTIDDILAGPSSKYGVYFNNLTGDQRFKGNIGLFKLDICYGEFKTVARRTLVAAMNYNEDTVKGISKAVNGNIDDAYRMIFHSEYVAADHHLLPFSKINADIVRLYGSVDLKKALGL